MSLTGELKKFARELGLDAVGITSAEPFPAAAEQIKRQIRRGLLSERWEIDSFTDPGTVLPDAKSIIVAAECYLTSEASDPGRPGEPKGSIAGYTRQNYYHAVKEKLGKLAHFLKDRTGTGFRSRCFSNNIRLAEKPMAQRAGIGWYGNHGIIVTRECGSWVVLGELITNVKLEEDKPCEPSCGECRLCVESCPTGAIVEPGVLNISKCLQHITHSPVDMPDAVKEAWGGRLYGCTTCQDVCPINRGVKAKDRKPGCGYVGPSLALIPILRMSEKEYRRHFRDNQMGARWVSFEAIQRNACVALGNIGDPGAIPVLARTLENNRSPLVKTHAAWALKKLRSPGIQASRLP